MSGNRIQCRIALVLLAMSLIAVDARADFATPGLGFNYTMDQLVAISGGAVTGGGGAYEVHESVIISLADRLTVDPGTTVTFVDTGGTIGLEVNGALSAVGTEAERIVFTGSIATPGAWRGLDYRDTGAGSVFHIAYGEIAYADEAVDVFEGDILLEHCEIHHSLGLALDISAADGEVYFCDFHDNQQRTAAINLTASPTIQGCGYGTLCRQTGANLTIRGNTIANNNIHPDQVYWGFGIACNGSNAPIVAENTIYGHWYGAATINGGQPNLGNLVNEFPGDGGANYIEYNGLGEEIYGFYNNTPLPQMAQGNWWGGNAEWQVEDAIYHQVDNSALGLVNYEFWLTALAADDVPRTGVLPDLSVHPNPFNPQVEVSFRPTEAGHVTATVLDIAGRVLRSLYAGEREAGLHRFTWDGVDRSGRPLASSTSTVSWPGARRGWVRWCWNDECGAGVGSRRSTRDRGETNVVGPVLASRPLLRGPASRARPVRRRARQWSSSAPTPPPNPDYS